MKEIAKGVFDATGSSAYEVSEDGKVVLVKSGVFVLDSDHIEVKKHVDAGPDLVISQRVTGTSQFGTGTGGRTPMPARYQGGVNS